jgi:hypothetical protein
MKLEREVIVDLLPAYFSGEASAATRALVEEYFREHPDFEGPCAHSRYGKRKACPGACPPCGGDAQFLSLDGNTFYAVAVPFSHPGPQDRLGPLDQATHGNHFFRDDGFFLVALPLHAQTQRSCARTRQISLDGHLLHPAAVPVYHSRPQGSLALQERSRCRRYYGWGRRSAMGALHLPSMDSPAQRAMIPR